MEQTPPTRVPRQRHTPTPKMSERKRSLFASSRQTTSFPTTIDEDGDLGPMSPLQFSCSPSTSETHQPRQQFTTDNELRTNFKNVMLSLSPLSSKNNRSAHNKCETTPVKHSFAANNPQYETIIDSPQSSRSSDMFRLEKENCIESAQKTPSTTDVQLPQPSEFPRVSFRKSLIFDTGMTPEEHQYSRKSLAHTRNASADNPETASSFDAPKARTSLSFDDKPQISAKTFYGSSFSVSTPIRSIYPFTPIAKKVDSKKTNPAKRPRSSISKKTQSNSGPFLGNSTIRHKIHKPKIQHLPQAKRIEKNRFQIIESAMDLIGARVASKLSDSTSKSNTVDEYKITREQIDKLQRIMRNQPDTLSKLSSKPLNWTGSRSKLNTSSSSAECNTGANDTFGQTSMLNNSELDASTASSCPDTEEVEHVEPKRKFFKSRTPSTSNNYTVMKGIKATVKRGAGGVTLLMAPESKRAKRNQSDYEELKEIRREVSDIIQMLTNSDDDDGDEITRQSKNSETTLTHTAQSQAITMDQSAAVTFFDDANDSALVAFEDLTESQRNYQRFSEMLPFNTDDPEVKQRQETLLSLLFTNNMCTEDNFRIFIAEPDKHEAEASRILEELFVLDVQDDMDITLDTESGYAEGSEDVPMSPASQISSMTSGLALDSPTTNKVVAKPSNSHVDAIETKKMFPVFERPNISNAIESVNVVLDTRPNKTIKWKPIGDKQYQIDAGQKKFGGTICSCGMFYSVHEPEDEALHQKYHDIYTQLGFKGWSEERVVCSVPEWGVCGRIICVTDLDTKLKRQRSAEFVSLVDRELGYADIPTKPQSIIYLAISKRQVVGVCVAEPLQLAHPLNKHNDSIEMMDLSTTVPVKCGISRIWVAEPHRRQGIAMRMFTAMRSHFIRGYTLRLSEVAFSSPTEMGRLFAGFASSKVLVY